MEELNVRLLFELFADWVKSEVFLRVEIDRVNEAIFVFVITDCPYLLNNLLCWHLKYLVWLNI